MALDDTRTFEDWLFTVLAGFHDGPVTKFAAETPDRRVEITRLQQHDEEVRVDQLIRRGREDDYRREKLGRDGETRESKARARSDVVAKCVKDGRLTKAHKAAADEILEIYEALQKAMFFGVRYEQRMPGGRSTRDATLDRLSARQQRMWKDWYKPWTRVVSQRKHRNHTHFEITLDLIADNLTPTQIGKRRAMKREKVLEIVAGALFDYACIAGIHEDRKFLRTGAKWAEEHARWEVG